VEGRRLKVTEGQTEGWTVLRTEGQIKILELGILRVEELLPADLTEFQFGLERVWKLRRQY